MSELKGWARLLQNIRGSGVTGLHRGSVRVTTEEGPCYCALGAAMPDVVITRAEEELGLSEDVDYVVNGDEFTCDAYSNYFGAINVTWEQAVELIEYNDLEEYSDEAPAQRLERVLKFLEQKTQEGKG